MTEEFITKGLQSDRYLKALRLPDQFDDEIEAVLGEFGQRMIEQQPVLFDQSATPDVYFNRTPSSALATHRVNYAMSGAQGSDSDPTPKLNVHLYWMPPAEYGRTDIDGALRAFGYKIKHADEDIDNQVAERTRAGDWPLETSGNPFDSSTAFYRHVSSMAEIEEAMDALVNHFSVFGSEYSVSSDEK